MTMPMFSLGAAAEEKTAQENWQAMEMKNNTAYISTTHNVLTEDNIAYMVMLGHKFQQKTVYFMTAVETKSQPKITLPLSALISESQFQLMTTQHM